MLMNSSVSIGIVDAVVDDYGGQNDNTTSMSLGYNKEVKHTLSEYRSRARSPHTEAGRRLPMQKSQV